MKVKFVTERNELAEAEMKVSKDATFQDAVQSFMEHGVVLPIKKELFENSNGTMTVMDLEQPKYMYYPPNRIICIEKPEGMSLT